MIKIEEIGVNRFEVSLNKFGTKDSIRIIKQNVNSEFVIYLDDQRISMWEDNEKYFEPEYPIYVFFYSENYKAKFSKNYVI